MTYIQQGERWATTREKINKVIKVSYAELLADTQLTYTADVNGSVSAGEIYPTTDGLNWEVAASDASDHHATTAGGVKLYEAGPDFSTRARAVAAHDRNVAAGRSIPGGTVWNDDQGQYRYLGDSTDEITGMTGWTVVVDYLKTGLRFPSRASFEAANLPSGVDTWEVVHPAIPSRYSRVLRYQRDASGTAITSDNGVNGSPVDDISVEHWGAVGDGVTELQNVPIQACLDWMTGGGKVHFYGEDYLTSAEITVEEEGVEFVGYGCGSFVDGTTGARTKISGMHLTGSVVRFMLESCRITDIVIAATASRTAAAKNTTAANANPGIRLEAADVAAPEGDVFNFEATRVHVVDQPGDGIIMVGRCSGSALSQVHCTGNGGHGLVLDDGSYTGRTNIALAGAVSLRDCTWQKNQGHGVRAGELNSTNYTYRIHVENCEGLNNCGDPTQLETAADSFYHCDSLTWIGGAMTGTAKSGASPANNAGIAVMGLGGTIIEPRILDTTTPILLKKHASRDCKGWTFINPHIRTTAAAHIIDVDSGVENVTVWAGDETGAITNATDTTSIPGLNVFIAGARAVNETQTLLGSQLTSFGMDLLPTKLNNQSITTTPATILDASSQGKKWSIHGMHDGSPCLSSFSCEVVGGSTPVVSNVQNQSGAVVTYAVTVSGTDIQLATSAGTRNSDIVIKEVIA